jgi:citrate synthase
MIMVETMLNKNQTPEVFFEKFIKGHEPLRSNGLGNDSYKTIDPRANISRELFHEYRKTHSRAKHDPCIQKALEVEEFVMGHPFFLEMGLYPNLDFYSAMIFHLLGIPNSMNNVIRVIGKLSGWLAHWHEQRTEISKAYRPAQVYTGKLKRPYTPIEKRGE